MNWDAIAAIGEIFGATAVVISLLYLASQTRQSRIAAEETAKYAGLQATHSMLDLYFDWRRTLFSNPEHKEIVAKANVGENLTNAEQFTLGLLFHDLFFAAAYSYSSAIAGGSVHEEEGDVEYITWILQLNPCAVTEWNRVKSIVARMDGGQFVSQVEKNMGSIRAGDT